MRQPSSSKTSFQSFFERELPAWWNPVKLEQALDDEPNRHVKKIHVNCQSLFMCSEHALRSVS